MVSGAVRTPGDADTVRRLALATAGDEKTLMFRVAVTAPTQVNLRVRVAEMSREMSRQIGFNLSGVSTGDVRLGVRTATPFNLPSLSALSVGGTIGAFALDAVLDALDRTRQIRVLAEPNLTALSGETANFLAGGEFPIIVPQSLTATTIEFKKFGVALAFTPTVISEGRINLHVRPEVSQLSTNGAVNIQGFTIPSLTTRRAETTVELASGESFAIAGLLRSESADNLSRFPGLGDIPILGTLFRSKDFQSNETELVIVVTPYLVRPTDRVAAPTDVAVPGANLIPGVGWTPSRPVPAPAAPAGSRTPQSTTEVGQIAAPYVAPAPVQMQFQAPVERGEAALPSRGPAARSSFEDRLRELPRRRRARRR
jgi:pilus assembly protein CpaC